MINSNGAPFFLFGDTAWTMFYRLSLSEAKTYFANRQSKGFNVVQTVITGPGKVQGLDPSYNLVNGTVPFINNDPTRPNESFFSYVDRILSIATRHNIYLALLPTWGEYVCPGNADGPKIFNTTNARIYGEWLGNRYKDQKNIIWVIRGDRAGNSCGSRRSSIWRALANGINS